MSRVSPREHGTNSCYSMGCRRDECREAHTVYTRERRRLSLAAASLTHGKRSTYDAGCRCDECRAARAARLAAERAAKGPRRQRAASCHCVYAWIDPATGDVLYVGMTSDPYSRIKAQRSKKPAWWTPGLAWALISIHDTRADALVAEGRAIRDLASLHNVYHARPRHRRAGLDEASA